MADLNQDIRELTEQADFIEAFPVMNQLRTDLTEESYLALLSKMRKNGYKLFALRVDEKIISLIGVILQVNFYNKDHVFIYDFVTDSEYRSKGYGYHLLCYIEEWAISQNAACVTLESAMQRTDAHRFYEEKLSYDKWCFSFRKYIK